jgi:cytochrome c biogenesis protein CcmG, thiol:disulfide interchange protein DsbE
MHEQFPHERRPATLLVLIIVTVCFILGIGLSYISDGHQSGFLADKSSLTPGELPPTLFPSPLATTSGSITSITPFDLKKITAQPFLQVGPLVGEAAPDFSLKTLNGQTVTLSALKGKAVLINLWATWCPPCRLEMPTIQTVYEKYKARGLVVLAINFTAQDDLTTVSTFVKELKLTFPILLDTNGDVSAISYGMHSLPMSFFIDPQCVIRNIVFGAMDPAKIEGYLSGILPKD